MRRAIKWVLVTAAAFGLLLGSLSLTRRHLHVGGLVLLGWDSKRNAVLFLHRPRLALDGPYLFRDAQGYLRLDTCAQGEQWRLCETQLPATKVPVVQVQVDNAATTRFKVIVRPTASIADADFAANPSRLLMLSDMEGEFDRFVALLQSQGVIDHDLHWRYGNGHVALVGDFVDRGQHVIPLLWLIYRLEGEAAEAGGRVHYVLGNHESMLLAGDMDSWPDRMIATAQALGSDGNQRLFSQATVLGQWLRTKPVIARVGDHLLVHGGISREFMDADLAIDQANALARPALAARTIQMSDTVRPVLGRAGVTRYRGLATRERRLEADPVEHLHKVATRYGIKRLAIGHTIAPDIALEHDDLLLRLDVHHKSQLPQAALYEGGKLWRVYADGRRMRLD